MNLELIFALSVMLIAFGLALDIAEHCAWGSVLAFVGALGLGFWVGWKAYGSYYGIF